MTTRATLRLGGLTAAIVMSLALVSSASAGGLAYHKYGLRTEPSKPLIVSTKPIHRGPWMKHKAAGSITVVGNVGPANRTTDVGPLPTVPVTPVVPAESSSFSWMDAAFGALFGLGLAMIAVYAAVTIRGRRGRLALPG